MVMDRVLLAVFAIPIFGIVCAERCLPSFVAPGH